MPVLATESDGHLETMKEAPRYVKVLLPSGPLSQRPIDLCVCVCVSAQDAPDDPDSVATGDPGQVTSLPVAAQVPTRSQDRVECLCQRL